MSGIECFVPEMSGEDISVTVESFSRSSAFTGVTVLSGVSLRQTQTLKEIAEAVSEKYLLIYTKSLPLEMGMLALDRIISIAEDTNADMLYAVFGCAVSSIPLYVILSRQEKKSGVKESIAV